MCEAVKRTTELSPRRHSCGFLCLPIHLSGVWIQTPPFTISDEEGIGAAFIKIKKMSLFKSYTTQRFWRTTWEECCPHCQEAWPYVWDLQCFHFTITLTTCFTWHCTLPITSLLQLERVNKVFFHSFLCLLSPQLGILWLPTPIQALHWWRDTALARITSQIPHPSEVHCSLECLYNLSDMSETDRLDFLIFRTWYPPEQNTAAFHYKPDEKVKFQPHIQHRQHKRSVRSEQAHNSRLKSRYYLSNVLWTEERMQIFT